MSTHRTIYGIASTRAFLGECVRYVPLHEHTLTPLVWSYTSTLTRMIFLCGMHIEYPTSVTYKVVWNTLLVEALFSGRQIVFSGTPYLQPA
jgi:hypothetical protein